MNKLSKKIRDENNKSKPKKDESEFILNDNDEATTYKTIRYDDEDILVASDYVYVLPYLIQHQSVILTKEIVKSFKLKSNLNEIISVPNVKIIEGESIKYAIFRLLEEKLGLIVDSEIKLDVSKPLLSNPDMASNIYFCVLPLTENEYDQIKINNAKLHNNTSVIILQTNYLKTVNFYDINSKFIVEEFKKIHI